MAYIRRRQTQHIAIGPICRNIQTESSGKDNITWAAVRRHGLVCIVAQKWSGRQKQKVSAKDD